MEYQRIQKKWVIKSDVPKEIQSALGDYPPLLQKLLYHRGCFSKETAEAYIHGRSPTDASPFLLSDMDAAVDRILFGIRTGEKIAIYGDYDADGITSTALLMHVFELLNTRTTFHIPDRFEEGYGLNIQALEIMKQAGIQLVITTDNGIRSIEEVEYAQHKLKMDVIVTDHHQPLKIIPQAMAVVNPKKDQDDYPFKELAGVGVAYKLADALVQTVQKRNIGTIAKESVMDLLDFVALGTVADVVPLYGENRSLVKTGLERLNRTQKVGLNALINAAKLRKGVINAFNLGFMLGPRINAAGRIDSAQDAINLLLSKDEVQAAELAKNLDQKNSARKFMTDGMVNLVQEMLLEEEEDAPLFFVCKEGFNSGLVGLVAAKLTEQYYRPAIVGEIKDEYVRASCRSIPEFHITKALDECAEMFERHGGHASAAGFTIHKSKVNMLKEKLKEIAKRDLAGLDLLPQLSIDEEIDLTKTTAGQIGDYYKMAMMLEPTGQDNEEAVFVSYNVPVKSVYVFGENNLRVALKCGSWIIDAIGFGMAGILEENINACDIVYSLGIDHYRNSFLLRIKDIRPARNHT